MSFSPTIQEIISQAGFEAQSCGNSRLEPEHLLIAMSRMVYDKNSNSNFKEDAAFLERFFKAGKLRPADLAERLSYEMKQENRLNNDSPCDCSTRCNQILKEASVYAEEENIKTVGLRHLLLSLLVNLDTNPVFRSIIKELGSNLGLMKDEVGLHQSRIITTEMTSNDFPITTKSSKGAAQSPEKTAGLNNPPRPRQSISMSVPNKAARSKFSRADIAIRQNNWVEAIKYYEDALQIFPSASPAWNNLGMAYMQLRKYDKSKQALQRAIIYDSHNADAYANLGVLFGGYLGKNKKAKSYFKEALRINPNHECQRYLENLQALRTQATRTVSLSQLLSRTDLRSNFVPTARSSTRIAHTNLSAISLNRPLSKAPLHRSVSKAELSLKQLKHAANYELFPKVLTRYMSVCIFFGVVDIAVGLGLYKASWLYLLLVAFGAFLALQGILSKVLHLRGGFLREGYILLGLGLTCIILFFETASGDMSRGGSIPWGKLVLLAFLGPFQIRAAFDCFSRHRFFAEMPIEPPLSKTRQCLEEIRKEIVNTALDSDSKSVEFFNRMGNWKGKLDSQVGTFVNVNLGDVLFGTKDNIRFKQLFPNRPEIVLQIGKKRINARMVEPSLSRMRRWCSKVPVSWNK
jgi:tetratricopeptide (TPR) repeat protein